MRWSTLNVLLSSFLFATAGLAHEMTPAYPQARPTSADGVVKFEMSLFNARDDVEFYELAVLNKNWELVRFAAIDRILHVPHDERIFFDVYIRTTDLDQAIYICTRSKLSANNSGAALVASTICSRTDGERP